MRLDWPKIKALSIEAGFLPEDSALFILPLSGRDLLMSIMERFTWEATFRASGYDYSDWDFLQSIVAKTENGLMGFVLMEPIEDQLARIADALEACCTIPVLTDINQTISELSLSPVINVSGGGGGCGNTLETWRVPVGWETDFPSDPIADDDTPTSEPGAYLCDSAHSAHFEIGQWFTAFADNVAGESPYTDVVEYMNLFSLVNPTTGWMYNAMTSVISLWYDDLLSDVTTYWQELKEAFICKVLEVDNAVALRAWVFEAIRAAPPTWSAGYYMEVLLTGTTFNIIYDGTYVPFPEFTGSDCAFCGEDIFPDVGPDYVIVTPIADWITHENVANGVGGHVDEVITYSASSGEWNGSFTKYNTTAIKASVTSGIRIDGYFVQLISADGVNEFDQIDLPVNMPAHPANEGEIWLFYNSSFAADFASIISEVDYAAPYGSAPIGESAATTICQSVSRFTPRSYLYRIVFLVRV